MGRDNDSSDENEVSDAESDGSLSSLVSDEEHKKPVRMLLLCFMAIFQGYAMVGNPSHALKGKLGIHGEAESAEFQDAVAFFQITKMLMRVCQIAFLVVVKPVGIVYLAYVVMFVAMMIPAICIYGLGMKGLFLVQLSYGLGGVAVGLFEGTFLSVISPLGKDTKTFVIMGAPLGFFINNTILATFNYYGMPNVVYYYFTALCLPVAMWIFHQKRPHVPLASTNGCEDFVYSLKHCGEWMPKMLPWFAAKFVGNFVLEDGFPLLFNVFNSSQVPFPGGPASTHTVPFALYTAWYWFPMMALGDTVSRRVPKFLSLEEPKVVYMYLFCSFCLCVGGESLNFLLIPIVAGLATFIANFGNGFIYGLSAKYIDSFILEEHRYAAYNLWCLAGDVGGYAGGSSVAVRVAHWACGDRHYEHVCAIKHKPEVTAIIKNATPAVSA